MPFLHWTSEQQDSSLKKAFIQHLFFFFLSFFPLLGLFYPSSELLGYDGAEVFGHAWVHWWRGEHIASWPSGTDLVLGMKNAAAIDPLAILVSSFFSKMAGTAFGYNVWIFFSLYAAAIGGWKLAERYGGTPWVGSILLVWSPPFLGSLQSGLSEDGGLGFVALAVAYIAQKKDWWKAGVCLALGCWSGLVLGWLAFLICFLVALRLLHRDRTHLPFLLGAFFVAGILCFPILWPHWERLSGEGHRSGFLRMRYEPLWRLNPWHQIDFASLFVPGRCDPEGALVRFHPAYLGLGSWILAIVSKERFWWLVSFLFVGLALGEQISVFGYPEQLWNPIAWMVHQIPFADRLNHHGRAMLMLSVSFSVMVSIAVRRMKKPHLVVFLLLELLLLSPISTIFPTTTRMPSPALKELRDHPVQGTALHIPSFGPGVSFQKALWLQKQHRKPLLLNPNRPGYPKKYASTAFMKWLMFPGSEKIPDQKPTWNAEVSILIVEESERERVQKILSAPKFQDARFSIWIKEK